MVSLFGKQNVPFALAYSVVGESHIKAGKPCQDASICIREKKYTLIVVADGHGDDPYFRSDVGSRFAVDAARHCMTDSAVLKAVKDCRGKDLEAAVAQLKRSIIGFWNMLVTSHMAANPFTGDELADLPEKYAKRYRAGEQIESVYGSTLIAVLWMDDFFLALQIGDGNCVMVDDEGTFSQPVPADENCFLNVTTSLCDARAIDNFRHVYFDALPAAVLIGSDGIDDCFAGVEKLYDFYRVVLSSFTEQDEETAALELADYLPRLSEKGSGDDVSIGMIVDKALLQTIDIQKDEPTPKS